MRRLLHVYLAFFARPHARRARPRPRRRGQGIPGQAHYVAGWHLPGGGVEVGETVAAALARELREEGNIELIGRAAAVRRLFQSPRVTRRDHVALYIVRSFRQSAPPQPNHEIMAHGFFARRRAAARHDAGNTRPYRRGPCRTYRRGILVSNSPRGKPRHLVVGRGPAQPSQRVGVFIKAAQNVAGRTLMRKAMIAVAAALVLGAATMATGAMAAGHGGGHGGGGGHMGGGHMAAAELISAVEGISRGGHFDGGHFGGGHFAGRGFGGRRGGYSGVWPWTRLRPRLWRPVCV